MSKWLIIIFIFLFSISLRLWNFNQMGKTWDEDAYVEWGYNFVNLVIKGDFKNPYWYKISASPPLSSYLFGIPARFDIDKFDYSGKPTFNYDYSHVRLISVLFSSLTVILVVFFGWKYISFFVGVIAGIILAMLPLFVGYSQLATLESLIIFFFTAVIFSFFNFLNNPSGKNIFLTGVLLGLALEVKYTNFLLVPLLVLIYLIWLFNANRGAGLLHFKSLLLILVIGFVTFFVLWPMPWFHLHEVITFNANLRNSPYSVPEVFFGKLMHVPKLYYFIYFLITTPLIILLLFILGLIRMSGRQVSSYYQLFSFRKIIDKVMFIKSKFSVNKIINFLSIFFLLRSKGGKRREWIYFAIVLWFLFPFIQSLYNFRQHGIRYIIEIYAPLALIAAIGFDCAASKITKKILFKSFLFLPIVIYLFLILIRMTPYYLEYFNIVVGGTRNVYEKKLFQMGWWGQGIREAAIYVINHAPKKSRIGYAISPINSLPPFAEFNASEYKDGQQYDYVIVNYFHVLREGFDDSNIKVNYKEIYNVEVDGAYLVKIYKRK